MLFHSLSPHMLGGMTHMAPPQMMVMTQGPAALQGKIVFLVTPDTCCTR